MGVDGLWIVLYSTAEQKRKANEENIKDFHLHIVAGSVYIILVFSAVAAAHMF